MRKIKAKAKDVSWRIPGGMAIGTEEERSDYRRQNRKKSTKRKG
jgi:hypothetical protein